MTNKLKCPFCNGELIGTIAHPICRNQNCVMCDDPMPKDLLEELIRTRKALDVAKERLKNIISDAEILATPEYLASRAKETLDQITALEQNE